MWGLEMARSCGIFSSTFVYQNPLVVMLWASQTFLGRWDRGFSVTVQPPWKEGGTLGDSSVSELEWKLVNEKAT